MVAGREAGKGEFFGTHGSAVQLMQYTGLKDKKGKDIYEGDIVIVKRIAQEAAVRVTDIRRFYSLCIDGWSPLKVIGNIYENPELFNES